MVFGPDPTDAASRTVGWENGIDAMWWIDRSEKKEEEDESFLARVDHDLALALPGCSYFTKPTGNPSENRQDASENKENFSADGLD